MAVEVLDDFKRQVLALTVDALLTVQVSVVNQLASCVAGVEMPGKPPPWH